MIGNDIIDLNVAGINSRWQEQRFLDKLFTKEEQLFILKDGLRFQNIWRLWSMKESAYKIHARMVSSSIFNPKSFHCKITSEKSGLVFFGDHKVNTTTENNNNVIYTTAYFQNSLHINKIVLLEGTVKQKHQFLKEKAIQAYVDFKSVSKTSVSILKNDHGVPQFFRNEKLQDDALTLTHHGQYGGFAISC